MPNKHLSCLLVFLTLFISACNITISTGENSQAWEEMQQIKEVVRGIFAAYNQQDVNDIMDYYDSDFLHSGNDYYEIRNLWEGRFGKYALVENIIVLQMENNEARVSFRLFLDQGLCNVPIDGYDDVTYLRKDNNEWKMYGNQKNSAEFFSIYVNSSPREAKIYLDKQALSVITPANLDHIPAGTHIIGAYLRGYNEEWETVEFDGSHDDVSFSLEHPSTPFPLITIIDPQNGATLYGESCDLRGYITNFEGESATLALNGWEYNILVDEFGDFRYTIPLIEGENTFFIRATNQAGNTGTTEDYHVYRGQSGELRIELTWNTDNTDLNLHIWDPDENHCYYNDPDAIPNGSLSPDNDGYGPETFVQYPVSSGIYTVKVHFFEGYDPANPTIAEIKIQFGDEEHIFTYEEFTADGEEEGAWWDVTDFEIVADME